MNIIEYIKKRNERKMAKRIDDYNRKVREDAVDAITIREYEVNGEKKPCITVNGVIVLTDGDTGVNMTDYLLKLRENYYRLMSYSPSITLL